MPSSMQSPFIATPPLGIYSLTWGSALHDTAAGVHRPLLAACLVFRDAAARTELVFVTLGVMVFWQEEAVKLRAAILSRLGLRPEPPDVIDAPKI